MPRREYRRGFRRRFSFSHRYKLFVDELYAQIEFERLFNLSRLKILVELEKFDCYLKEENLVLGTNLAQLILFFVELCFRAVVCV